MAYTLINVSVSVMPKTCNHLLLALPQCGFPAIVAPVGRLSRNVSSRACETRPPLGGVKHGTPAASL